VQPKSGRDAAGVALLRRGVSTSEVVEMLQLFALVTEPDARRNAGLWFPESPFK